ncbi:MAG: substrate-binding domain-containing protein [Chloroflexota bacterium]
MIPRHRHLLIGLIVLTLLGAAGCTENPAEETTVQEVVTVAITPAARHTNLAVVTCASTINAAAFEISEAFSSQAEADLLIQLGEPNPMPGFAAQIAVEELAIVIHRANPAGSLTLDQVQQLFSGTIQNWEELGGAGGTVQVWSLLEADETRQVFIQQVLNNGLLATNTSLAPSPEIMLSSIAGNHFSIGYLPKSWATQELVSILPGVRFPVLVLAESQPQGPAADLVSCLQGELGQQVLTAFFPN